LSAPELIGALAEFDQRRALDIQGRPNGENEKRRTRAFTSQAINARVSQLVSKALARAAVPGERDP
jgi:hypothetical protein